MVWLDLIILLAYLTAVLSIGWFCRNRQHDRTGEEHFLANRRMGWWPIGISIMVTSFSAMNFIAIPEEISGNGLYVIFCFPVFFLAAWPVSKIWMPYFHRLNATSVYEFLEVRFSREVRLLASGLFLFWRCLWMATALYVSGKILGIFTQSSPVLMIAVCGLVTTCYAVLGGMKAVMWTDMLQFFVIIIGIGLAVLFAIQGSPDQFMNCLQNAGRLKPFTPFDATAFSLNPTIRLTFWSALIGTFAAFMTRYGADQVVMQRYFTAKNLKQAQRGIWLNAIASTLALTLLAILGLAIYVHAETTGAITANTPMPRGMALKQLIDICRECPKGFCGLIIAGVLASTMSSIDSGINACSAAAVTDFKARLSARKLTFFFGTAITLSAILILKPLNQYQSLFVIINKIVNGLGTPLLAVILLAMFSKRATAKGVFYGTIVGIAASLVITFGVTDLAIHYYAPANLIACLTSCMIISRATK